MDEVTKFLIKQLLTDYRIHEADKAAHTLNPLETLRTGVYVSTIIGTIGAGGYSADKIRVSPFIVIRALTIDRIAIEVTAASAGGTKARLGIYKNGVNLYPAELLIDGGEVAVDSNGVKAVAISQALTKGIYWLAITCDAAPIIRDITPAFTFLDIAAANLSTVSIGWTVAAVYAALADPYPAGGAVMSLPPLILPRIASLD